jgi:hypothetical protein
MEWAKMARSRLAAGSLVVLLCSAPGMSAAARSAGARVVRGFRTEKGSFYQVHSDGSTTRTKTPRPEHPGDYGLQPRSKVTFYVTPEQANALAEIDVHGGPHTILAPLGDGRVGVKYTSGKDVGRFERHTVVTPRYEPALGLMPVEIWETGRRQDHHFGHRITQLSWHE